MALSGEEVDDPVELRPFADRDLHRDHLRGEPLLDLGVDLLEVRVLLVHHRDEDDPRQPALLAVVPDLLGPHFDAGGAREHNDRPVGRPDAGQRVAGEVQVAGGIDQVELGVHPLGHRQGQVDGVLALDFVGGVIGEGGAVLDGPMAFARAGHEREGVDQRCLAARAVAHDRHVADFSCLVDTHAHLRPRGGLLWTGGTQTARRRCGLTSPGCPSPPPRASTRPRPSTFQTSSYRSPLRAA